MTTSLDTKVAAKVVSVINTYGTSYTFSVRSAVHDVTTGHVTKTESAAHTVKGTPPNPYNIQLVDGSVIRKDDLQVLIAGSGLLFTPVIGMKVVFDSIEMVVINLKPIYSGDDIAAWDIQLRRA